MKRRAIVAGLLVVALAALGAVLVQGSGGQGAEVTKGRPFTGPAPVTRDVAWIESRQRYLDRHPEIERSQARADVAQEAVRGEAVGERAPAEAADTHIREKPEPGEQTGPPRTAASARTLQRTGQSAIGPKSSLSAGTSFLGVDSNDSGFVPPDSMGAVGPTQILVSVNGHLRLFDKQGTADPNLDVSDSAFWDPVLPNNVEPTDPGVEYDRLSQRWIISAIDIENTDNRVMIAVSDGPTITDESSFDFFFFKESAPLPSQPQPHRFADYPQLAVDKNAIYIGVNEFTNSSGSFHGTNLYVVRKSSVLDGGTPPGFVVTGFRTVTSAAAQGPDSPQPATNMDPSVDNGYVVGPDNQLANRLDVLRVTNPGGTPSN